MVVHDLRMTIYHSLENLTNDGTDVATCVHGRT